MAITMLLITTATLQSFELHNPASTCNAQQSLTMKTKCKPLSGAKYGKCERETLKQFFKCVKSNKGENNGK